MNNGKYLLPHSSSIIWPLPNGTTCGYKNYDGQKRNAGKSIIKWWLNLAMVIMALEWNMWSHLVATIT